MDCLYATPVQSWQGPKQDYYSPQSYTMDKSLMGLRPNVSINTEVLLEVYSH